VPHGSGSEADAAAARGRRVYIEEGCIHCHSQYVRPGAADEVLWGPARGIGEGEPPLIGVRRQGPDLLNAGNRRSAAWHRLHLIDPGSLMPGSRMPGYAHLFTEPSRGGSGSRGDDLVAYLAQLGQGTAAARLERAQVTPLAAPAPPSPERGRRLFARYCSPCHGAAGRGDGRFAAQVAQGQAHRAVMNLTKEHFWLIDRGPGAEPETRALARLVRWGVPGTGMPGHETLTEQELFDLAAWVETLPREGRQ
jgi:cytochrome c oxidase cbb3-type subunit 2